MDYLTILMWVLKIGAVVFIGLVLSCCVGLLVARLFAMSILNDDDATDERMKQAATLAQLRADMDRRRQERAADARDLRKGGDHAA